MRTLRKLQHCLTLLFALLASAAHAQKFAQPTVIPTGNWPAAVYSADLNGDGYPDLIYIDQGATPAASTTHVLLNDGQGNFTPSATLSTAGTSLVVADVDADGHPDILWLTVTSFGQLASAINATLARGKGDGTFQPATLYASVSTTEQPITLGPLVAAHISQQTGPLDVAFENTATAVLHLIYPQAGNSFATASRTLHAAGPITVADLNNDGYQDLILQQGTADAIIYRSLGSVGLDLHPAWTATGTSGIHSLLVADVNYDGIPDLIVEGAAGHIDVFPGNGDGTFQTISIGGTGPLDGTTGNGGHLIALGDFNHDNLIDALTATPAGISTLLGNGTAYLGLNGIYNAGPGGNGGPASTSNTPAYAVADFNHDGNPDLALDSPEGIAILYGNSDGTFQTSRAYAAGFPAESVALSFFQTTKGILGSNNSTGPMDAVVGIGAAQAMLLYGNGDGTFHFHSQANNPNQPGPTTDTPGPPGLIGTVLAVDWNLDGKPDIAIAADGPPSAIPSSGSGVTLQYGDGTGNFALPTSFFGETVLPCPSTAGSTLYGHVAIAGEINASVLGYYLYTRNLQTIQAFGAPSLAPYDVSSNGPCTSYPHNLVAAGNLVYYGSEDALLQQGSHMYILLKDPYAIFDHGVSSDLSVDGSATTPGQLVAPQLSSTFGGVSPTLGFPAFPGSAIIKDLDGDGLDDIIVAYDNMGADHTAPTAANPNYIYIWYNSGNGKFLTSAKHPVNPVRITPSRNFYQVAVADVNGDKIPDLILSDGYLLSVQLGKGDGSFGAETHYLAGQGINGIAFGDVRQTNLDHNDLVIANGGVLLANPVANHDLLATNPDVNTGGITVLLNQTPALITPTGTVAASPEPSTFGNSFLLTATLQAAANSPTPTGTIQFLVNGVLIGGRVALIPNSNGTASASVVDSTVLAPNTYGISAIYYDSIGSPTQPVFGGTHTITAAAATNSILATPEPSVAGAPFTLTATAGPGTFAFSVDGTPIGTVVSTTNTASIAGPTTLNPGTHTISATWLATQSALAVLITGTHVVTINSTALSLILCVDNPGSLFPCATPIGATPLVSPITFFYGQSLDGVAIQSATNLTGNIVFYDNTTVFCSITANLRGGANTCPSSSGYLHAGARTVHALYTGDSNNAPATSNSIAVNVFPDPTTATSASSANPAVVGTAVTFTAKFAGNYATPVGPVTFYDGAAALGTVTLDPTGQAILTTLSLAIGSHPITVAYAGSPDFNPVITPLLIQVITPALITPPSGGTGFTLTVTPAPISVGAGNTGILLVTIKTAASFTQSVQLSCSGLPEETSCTFVAPTLPAGGGATTLQLHVSAPHDCNTDTPYFIGTASAPGTSTGLGALGLAPETWVSGSAAALLLGLFTRRRRKLLRPLLLLFIALAGLASLSGCGHCTDLGTRPGAYTFTVTATASSQTASQTIPLTVTIP